MRVVPKVEPDVLQSWAHLLDTQYIEPGTPVRRLLDERRLSFVTFSPLAQGILLGKYRPGTKIEFERGDHRRGSPRFQEQALHEVEPKLARIKARFGDTPRRSPASRSNTSCRTLRGLRDPRLPQPSAGRSEPGRRRSAALTLGDSGRARGDEELAGLRIFPLFPLLTKRSPFLSSR